MDAILRSMEGAYATPLACEAVRCFALVMDKGTSARVDAWLGDLLARKQPHRSGWQHGELTGRSSSHGDDGWYIVIYCLWVR